MGLFKNRQDLKIVLNAMPAMVWVVDRDVRILEANRQACNFLEHPMKIELKRLCGEVIGCFHESRSEETCGKTEFCDDCLFRKTTEEAFAGAETRRRLAPVEIEHGDGPSRLWFQISASPFPFEGRTYALLAVEEVTELIKLRGLIPMCAHCSKVRDDDQYWRDLREYIESRPDLCVSHGLCPECRRELYPDLKLQADQEEQAGSE